VRSQNFSRSLFYTCDTSTVVVTHNDCVFCHLQSTELFLRIHVTSKVFRIKRFNAAPKMTDSPIKMKNLQLRKVQSHTKREGVCL